jgi:hypothetical protein
MATPLQTELIWRHLRKVEMTLCSSHKQAMVNQLPEGAKQVQSSIKPRACPVGHALTFHGQHGCAKLGRLGRPVSTGVAVVRQTVAELET